MPNINVQTAASGDDGGQKTGSVGFRTNAATETLGYFTGATHLVCGNFWRFTGITIPAGATIDSATVTITQQEATSGIELKLAAVDEDNPAAPTTGGEYDADPLTTAQVDWDFNGGSAGDTHQSPDIKTIIQELVDSYTISNSAIIIRADNDGPTGDNYVNVRHYDYSGNVEGPVLDINYTEAGGAAATGFMSMNTKIWGS